MHPKPYTYLNKENNVALISSWPSPMRRSPARETLRGAGARRAGGSGAAARPGKSERAGKQSKSIL